MRLTILLALLVTTATAWAYHPAPVVKSAAEQELAAALANAPSDSIKLRLAQQAFENHPDDIPLAVIAQDVLLKQLPDAKTYYKTRAQSSESGAAHYLYGRASGDSTIMRQEAQYILKMNPADYWGQLLAGLAEWEHEKSNDKLVQKYFEAATASDPSRPEAYLNLGWLFMDHEKWADARTALEAGAVADGQNTFIRDARLTVYAQLRDGKSYFSLLKGVFPEAPLTVDLPRANGSGSVTTADIAGSPTVLEYWAFT
jgi:hypothetical protein